MTPDTYPKLQRGDLVQATDDFDLGGANVKRGMYGVCFEEANHYGDGAGPMVRWFGGGVCNVYDGYCVAVPTVKGESPRVVELLEANNRYLEDSRAAHREVLRLNRLVRILTGDGEVQLAEAHKHRMLLMAELTQDAAGSLVVEAYRVYRDGTVIFMHKELAPAYTVYIDNVENILLEQV